MKSREQRRAEFERREVERKALYAARIAKVSTLAATAPVAHHPRPYRPSRLALMVGALIPGIGQLQRARLGRQYADNWRGRIER